MASTIYDIAERAGVGIATVSRVINGSSRVSDRTRAQVQAAMNELGFRPNAAARRCTQPPEGCCPGSFLYLYVLLQRVQADDKRAAPSRRGFRAC
jgi:hypothetical protein